MYCKYVRINEESFCENNYGKISPKHELFQKEAVRFFQIFKFARAISSSQYPFSAKLDPSEDDTFLSFWIIVDVVRNRPGASGKI